MTQIVYDTTGKVIRVISGSYDTVTGIPVLEVEVPEGKQVVAVDVTTEVHTPIFADLPKSEVLTRIEMLETALNELVLI